MLAVDGISLDPSRTLYSARQLGMGGISIGFSDDASGVFANPSGMADNPFPQFVAASRKLVLDETQYTLLCWAIPTNWGTIGLGYTGLNIGGSSPTQRDPATNRILVDPSSEATAYENSVIGFSYSRKINNNLSIGGCLKLFNQSLSGGLFSKVSATGVDLSATYKPLSWLTAGANLQNIVEGNLAWEGGANDKIGGFYKLGLKVNILGSPGEALLPHSQKLLAGFDLDIPHSTLSSSNYHIGVDYFPLEKIALRAGLNTGELTLGIGVINGGFRFDYAYVQRPDLPGDGPHYFSLSYVGERTESSSYKLKKKESAIKWTTPKDRSITDQSKLAIKFQAQEKRILEQKNIWTVTAVSDTFEVRDITEYKDLSTVYLNGIIIDNPGIIETLSPLAMGRNVFQAVAYSSPEVLAGKTAPEVFTASSEAKVLRFDPFSDTPLTHWAIEPIALSVTLGLVKGYPDDTFRPERGITRAELITLLVRTMPVSLAEEIPYSGFKDVSAKNWAAKYIAYGSYKELVTGYPDGTFQPNKVLSRAEGVTVLTRYSNLVELPDAPLAFPDLQPDFWANKYIAAAKQAGLLQYLVGKNFEPPTPFTRAEACEVIYRTPQVQNGVNQFWETGVISGAIE
ncbi:MAG: S-layer homology domain-containing protein [Candidatus Margulisiibacteriota bacterium]